MGLIMHTYNVRMHVQVSKQVSKQTSTVDTRLLADSRISRDPEVEAQKLVKSL